MVKFNTVQYSSIRILFNIVQYVYCSVLFISHGHMASSHDTKFNDDHGHVRICDLWKRCEV